MKSFKIEIENGIEYVVYRLNVDEMDSWKRIVKENFDYLGNPNFKFTIFATGIVSTLTFYTNKYKLHNINGPALIGIDKDIKWHLDDVKYESEEEYINELRSRILNEILDEKNNNEL